MTNLIACIPIAMIGVILLLLPNSVRHGILFAVPVTPGFATSSGARHAVWLYRRTVAFALAIALLVAWRTPASSLFAVVVPTVLVLIAAAFGFYQAHRLILPYRATLDGERSVDLFTEPDRPPVALWLAIGPFLLLALAALFLYSHWSDIPEKFPVHWSLDGLADRWSLKTVKGVYGPLAFAATMCTSLVISAFACWFGARRSNSRSAAVNLFIGIEYLLAVIFSLAPLKTVLAIPNWLVLVLTLGPFPIVIWYLVKKASEPSDSPEKTPDECWHGGFYYSNPNDPALVVEKRSGFGYTLNFANPWSWALIAVNLAAVATGPFVLM